jgi:type VI secretion system secreted protein Hcp
MLKKTCLSLAVSTALIAGVAQRAEAEYLIRIAGISGTSNIRGFEDYIAVESWSLGFARGVCQDLHFTKQMDAASPDLTAAAMLGTFYPSIILVALKEGEAPFVYMRLSLANSFFTSFQTAGSGGSAPLPVEQISLQPSSVKIEAFEQNAAGDIVLAATNTVTCPKPK